LVSAVRSAAITLDFAQNRFALRSVIATNLNIATFAGNLLARLPRLRRGFALKNFLASGKKIKRSCACPTRPVRGHLKLNSLKFSLYYENNAELLIQQLKPCKKSPRLWRSN